MIKNKVKKIETNCGTFHSNSHGGTIFQGADICSIFESIYSTILKKIQKYQTKGSGCTIDSVIERNINTSKYKPLSGNRYIKFPKELNHSKKT